MKYFKKLLGDRIYLSPRNNEMEILAEEFEGDFIRNKNI